MNDFQNNYRDIKNEMNDYMNQLSTGKKFDQVSEAPLDATKALKLKSSIKFNKQYADNVETGIQWLKTTDDALADTVSSLRRVRDLAVQGANETMTTDDRKKLAAQVDQIKDHLIQLGNTKYGDRYIFNGTKTQTEPYENSGTTNEVDYEANGAISTDTINREVSEGITVNINSSGRNVGADTDGNGEGGFRQIFADLQQLSDDLNSGNTPGIENAIDNIDQHIESSLSARSGVGARQQRLELTQSRLETKKTNYTKVLSKTEDVDIAEVIMKMKNSENVYRAALSTGAKTIQPSLVDFLR